MSHAKRWSWMLMSSALLLASGGCAELDAPDVVEQTHALSLLDGERDAAGSFSCDLVVDGATPMSEVTAIIERDRMHMSRRPGFQNKSLPLLPDATSGHLISGGRYLFDSFHDAAAYHDWVRNAFVLDGERFLERPMFLEYECYHWRVVGAHEFAPIEEHAVMRTERFSFPTPGTPHDELHKRWDTARDTAQARGYAAVWLMHNADEGLAQLVYWTVGLPTATPDELDFAGLAALQTASPLGDALALPADWTRVFDRTHWVLTTWHPFLPGDHGQPSTWPNSPPLPEPFCTDGVCQGSRGEDGTTCPEDCSAQCGDTVCQADEDEMSCAGDCPL